ncbi:AraC family transcriptional regulator [Flavobacterium seoulense]|uniref:DNA-binding protein n=1 Tax=Flavobacterium seoulense TaxID=1492738 RepID=A0A066WNN5_9FLAO|nr:AraC family transcriptional regulator [Flavobacterium seoulense]KDN54208.1 DNA-binding protein [Flavobacterium seoulense]
MKFKSSIVGRENPITVIETDWDYNQKSHFVEEKTAIKEDDVEQITINNLIAEGILIVDTKMFFAQEQIIKTEMIGEAIVMNFIFSNNLESHIDQVEEDEYSIENTHNILYASRLNATFKIPALEEINYLSIILSPEFYSKMINEDWGIHKKFSKNIIEKKTGYLTPKYAPFNSGIQWIIHEIKKCTYEGSMKKMYLEAKIKELLIFQLDSLIEKPKNTEQIGEEDLSKLMKAKLILEKNFTNAPSLPELARLISLNEFKLKKGFKTCFKTTIKSYVTQLRMEYAKDLFKNETSNVGEVAYKCGYKDVSHFSAAFKFFYGFTPASFRKINIGTKIYLLYWNFFDTFYLDILSFECYLV